MRSFEIRLVGRSGRFVASYIMGADHIHEVVERAKDLLNTHPEYGGAQIQCEDHIHFSESERMH